MTKTLRQSVMNNKSRHEDIMEIYDDIVRIVTEIDKMLAKTSYKRSISEANMGPVIKSYALIKELKSKL